MRLAVLITAGALVLLQAASALIAWLARAPGKGRIAARAAVVLALLSPVVICLLLVIGVHLTRYAPFAPIDLASRHAALGKVECDALCQFGSIRFFAGLSLLALAGLGILSMVVVFRGNRKRGVNPAAPLALGLGASLGAIVLGWAALWMEKASEAAYSAWDGAGQRLAEAILQDRIPMVFVVAFVASVVVAVLIYFLFTRNRTEKPGADRLLLSCAVVLLSIGVVAFAFTRRHAHDVKAGIPHLIGGTDDAGHYLVPGEIDSAVFGKVNASTPDPDLRLDPGIELPVSTAGIEYKWAFQVQVSRNGLAVEGIEVVELEDGRLPESGIDEEKQRIPALYRLLAEYSRIASMKKDWKFHERIFSLHADERVPYESVDLVVKTAAQAGFPDFRLVVLQKRARPLSRAKVSVINASAPFLACLGDDERAEPYRESKGEDVAPLEEGIAKRLRDALPRSDDEELDRFATVSLPDLVEFEDQDRDSSDRDVLLVGLSARGLNVSARNKVDGKVLPDLGTFLPRGESGYDFEALTAKAAEIHERYPGSDTVLVSVEEGVMYGDVVRVLDATRERILDPKLDTRLHIFTNACIVQSTGKNF